MAVAFDAQSYKTFTTSTTNTHTPVGTPKGIWVSIVQTTASTDRITNVTYGGINMQRVSFAIDATTEPGCVYTYFLGKGIPTGAQTLSITVSAGTEAKIAWCMSVTAASDTQIAASAIDQDNKANPFVILRTLAAFSGIVAGAMYSGLTAATGSAVGSGYTKFTGPDSGGRAFGSNSAVAAYGAKSGASILMEWTSATDDVAFAANAIQEVANGGYAIAQFSATGTWRCPPGVTSVLIQAWGSGGGGGGVAANTNKSAAGGAGGQYVEKVVSVTPGTLYTVTVGNGGTAGASTGGNGGTGGDVWFDAVGTVIAKGGAGGQSYENGFTGGAGSTTSGIGDTVRAGGSGGNGGAFAGSGGGGEAGNTLSTGANGGNGSTGVAGAAGSTTNGDGGNGGAGSVNGAGGAGVVPGGGGGGGAVGANTTNRAGGVGGKGQLQIIYLVPSFTNLTDDFDDNSVNTSKWSTFNDTNVTTSETSQVAQVAMVSATGGQYGGYESLVNYDLSETFVMSQVVNSGNQVLELDCVAVEIRATGDTYNWIISGGNLIAHKFLEGIDTNLRQDVAYDSNVHKYFRIRESGGTIYWEYSTTGVEGSFTVYTSETASILFTNMQVAIVAGIWGAAGSTTCQFDNFNILQVESYLPRFGFINHASTGVL